MSQNQKSISILPVPESTLTKKEQVAEMFDNISYKYDFLNHFLSLGIDKIWRKKAIKSLKDRSPKTILDVATGTGDFAVASLALSPKEVIGVDISAGMLQMGQKKIKQKGVEDIITLTLGDSEHLPFENDQFEAITCGYGVRNFENLEKGLKDMHRVMKPGGKLAILEFSKPKKFPIKQFFSFYFRYILPKIGKLFSKDNRAYTYLPESVKVFPEGEEFCEILEKCGFKNVKQKPLSFGITTLYNAEKI
ncbi:MAG TPA: bifunctional demethylmenaquinone methyltransferase/2-methoxy-6-polyprenyl-1,4-benzoquinol methylase UbiE [Chitinophagaceae bacterium]|nr:bifunctional demethylmenaquinone methyltransferase/2-methoxy-6-polyprenyl-1,4-benzoquinol methylase UbiE [Chitinophagaceae bacterium]